MPNTMTAVLTLLQLVAGPGAGWLASWAFDLLREVFPRAACARWPRWLAALLWEPHTATLSAPLLAAVLAGLAGFGVAVLRAEQAGSPLLPVVDEQLAALITAAIGWLAAQARHRYETRRVAEGDRA